MRHIFGKFGGSLAETGTVSAFAFEYVGMIDVFAGKKSPAETEEILLESDAIDYSQEDDGSFLVITERADLFSTFLFLREHALEAKNPRLEYREKSTIAITDFDKALKMTKLLQELEEDEDTEMVWTNVEIGEDLQTQVEEAFESQKFKY